MSRLGQPPAGFFPPPGGLPDPMLVNTLTYLPPGAPAIPPAPPQWMGYDTYGASAPGGPPIIPYVDEAQYPPPPPPPPMREPLPPLREPSAPPVRELPPDPGMAGPPPANYTTSDFSGPEPPTKLGRHIPLAKCRVLYIGTAIPTETSEGIKAVQEPLRKRYVTDGSTTTSVPGVDAWLTVFSSGLMLQYITDKKQDEDDYITWLPIHTLHVSAAVKCVTQVRANGERYSEFVALDSPVAQRSNHPPIFAVIMRRTKGVKVLECHAFICKSSQAAMSLVQSTTHAYEHKEGWMEDEPPKYMQTLEGTLDAQDADAQPVVPLFQPATDQEVDRPNTKSNGYFLLLDNNSKLIKSYNVQHPNKLATPKRGQKPPAIPAEPRPAGAYVPAPSQYLSDFGDLRGYPVFEFPGFVSQEKYKATMKQIRKQRGRLDIPQEHDAKQSPYLAPVRYDYQDEFGNYYYVGDDDDDAVGSTYRGRFPEQQPVDDVAYLAQPTRPERSRYAKYLGPSASSDDGRRRQYDDRQDGGNNFEDFANVAGFYP